MGMFDDLADEYGQTQAAGKPKSSGLFDDLIDEYSAPKPTAQPRTQETELLDTAGGYVKEFGQRFALGTAEDIASRLRGSAAVTEEDRRFQSALEGIQQGEDIDVALQRPPVPVTSIADEPLYRAGEKVSQAAKSFIGEPAGNLNPIVGDVAGALGSVASNILLPIGIPQGGMGEAAQRAVREGATPEQQHAAARLGGIAGATDYADILLTQLGSTGKALGFIKRVGLRALEGAAAQGGQEGVQQLIQNKIAQGVYKPDQDVFEDVPYSAFIGAITGGVVSGATGGRAQPQASQEVGATPFPLDIPAGAVPAETFLPAEQPPAPPQADLPQAATPSQPVERPAPPAPTGGMFDDLIDEYRTLSDLLAEEDARAAAAAPQPFAAPAEIAPPVAAPQTPLPPAPTTTIAPPVSAPPAELPGRQVPTPSLQDMLDDPRPAAEIRAEIEAARNWQPSKDWQAVPRGAALDLDSLETKTEGGETFARIPPTPGTKAAPVVLETPQDVHAGAEITQPDPTPAQIEAGNYRKRHIKFLGRDISIETEQGATRIAKDGSWSVPNMPAPYGGILGTKGTDGDPLDITIGPNPKAKQGFIIDQINPDTGKFDELKTFGGFSSEAEARAAYVASFSDGKGEARIGAVTAMPVAQFKAWLKGGNHKKALAYKPPVAVKQKTYRAKGPLNLLQFIAAEGGLRPDAGGELKHMGLTGKGGRIIVPGLGYRNLVRPGGMTFDQGWARAVEAGYINDPGYGSTSAPLQTSNLDFVRLVAEGAGGRHTYAVGDETAVAEMEAKRASEEAEERLAGARADVQAAVKELIILANDQHIEAAARLVLAEAADPADAIVDVLYREALAEEGETAQNQPQEQDDGLAETFDLRTGTTGYPVAQAVEQQTRPGRNENEAAPQRDQYAQDQRTQEEAGAREVAGPAVKGFDTSKEFWHGTTSGPFTKFKESTADDDVLGPAIYLSRKREGAKFYGEGRDGITLGPFFVRGNIVNPDTEVPWIINPDGTIKSKAPAANVLGWLKGQLATGRREAWGDGMSPTEYTREFWKRRGVDGYNSGAGFEVAIYDPNNIKAGFDVGADGKPQLIIPGAEQIGQGEQAQRAADKPLKAKVAQKPLDIGMFGDESKQTDLMDLAQKSPPPTPAQEPQETPNAPETGPSDSGAQETPPAAVAAKSVGELRDELARAKLAYQEMQRKLDAMDRRLEEDQPKPRNQLDKDRLDRNRSILERNARSLRRKVAEALDAVDDARKALKQAEATQPPAKPKPEPRRKPVEPEPAASAEDMDIPDYLRRDKPLASLGPRPVTETVAFKSWFKASKVVDKNGDPLTVYHGARRSDRIVQSGKFDPKRATSGPMAFFTDNPELASSYATSKPDTSLEDEGFHEWFRVKLPGRRSYTNLDQSWWSLPQEERARISALAPRVRLDYDTGEKIELGETDHKAGVGNYDWEIKQSRGNPLKALVEGWLNAGTLFGQEERFLDVLKTAGVTTKVEMFDPNAEYPGVIPVYLSIQNPLDTSNVPNGVVDALDAASRRTRTKAREFAGDFWHKAKRDPRDWMRELHTAIAEGKNSHVWTSIPDWVTKTLRAQGYDGIRDRSGKGGGEEHSVWIPFSPEQIKSATGNRGTFDPSNPKALFALSRAGPRLTPRARASQADIERGLSSIVSRVAGHDVKVEFDQDERLPAQENLIGYGSAARENTRPLGLYYPARRLIRLAIGSKDPRSTAYHESWHDVEIHLLTDEEIDFLKAETARLRSIVARQFGYSAAEAADLASYEVRAMAFEVYSRARETGRNIKGMHVNVRSIFDRIRRMLHRVRNMLNSKGFRTAEDIFSEVFEGKFADRPDLGAMDIEALAATRAQKDPTAGQRQQAMQGFIARGQPLDRALRVPFDWFGGTTKDGKWEPGMRLHDKAAKIIVDAKFSDTGKFSFVNPLFETVRSGLIDRYNLRTMPEYVKRERERALDERAITLQGAEVLKTLKDHATGPAEAKVLQAILTGENVSDADMQKLAEPIRAAIDQLGQEAVDLGLLSRESFERNRGTYLHRVYQKYEAEQNGLNRMVNSIMGNRRKRIIGDQFRGRGMFHDVDVQRLMRDVPDWKEGAKGRPHKGEKFLRLDELAEQRDMELDGKAPPPRVTRTVWWPADSKVPDQYSKFRRDGTWELRGEKGGKFVLWRDFSKDERERMGEILDARYTIAKTFMLMAHDLANGRFYQDIAKNEAWAKQGSPSGEVIDAAEWLSGRHAYKAKQFDWVKVPDTDIPNSGGKKRWGALSGKYVREEIWRDLHEINLMSSPNVWRTLLTQWKLSKTARSPVVHMNNVMSNFVLMDLLDVRGQDLVKGVNSYWKKDEHYKEAFEQGAFGTDMMTQEIRDNVLRPILEELNRSNTFQQGGRLGVLGQASKFTEALWSRLKNVDQKFIDAYRVEDEIFRMAAYIRRRELGDDPKAAAETAREQFIDYDIRAPWVRVARNTALPFISYTYRTVPLLARAIATRPWKIGKYAMLAYLANALAYSLSGGDEEKERKSLRDKEAGRNWLGGYHMTRMPFNDKHGNPMFLDIRRWVPAGDIFDMTGDVPSWMNVGGPLMIAGEVVLNRSAFTGNPIFNPETDNWVERQSKRAGHLYQSAVPSAPWVPGSFYWDRIGNALRGATDQKGRPYDPALAVASSVGIKLKPQDVDNAVTWKKWEINHAARALKKERGQLERRRARKMISESAYKSEVDEIDEKLKYLQERMQEVNK